MFLKSHTHLLTTVGHHPQCFGDAHDPTRIGWYSPDRVFGRHLMLYAEHGHTSGINQKWHRVPHKPLERALFCFL